MSSFELPQDAQAGGVALPENQEVVAQSYTFENTVPAAPRSTQEGISGVSGAPIVLDVEKFKAMTPAESFALAGELVKRNREVEVQKENAVVINAEGQALEENKKEAEIIAAEIATEEAALVEKYGSKESWPEEAKKKSDLHRLGWGMAGVAGLSVLGGLAATDAQAQGLGTVIGQRVQQGIQIEANRANYREQAGVQGENQRMQVEMRIEQGRSRLEQRFQQEEAQKNMRWEQEYNQQTTEQGKVQVKARQDAEWNNYVRNVEIQRQQFETNANMQRRQVDMQAQAHANQVNTVSNSLQRQANVNAAGRALGQSVYKIFGR